MLVIFTLAVNQSLAIEYIDAGKATREPETAGCQLIVFI